nr:hypothetical protein [Tanacetum cinerariifolium]
MPQHVLYLPILDSHLHMVAVLIWKGTTVLTILPHLHSDSPLESNNMRSSRFGTTQHPYLDIFEKYSQLCVRITTLRSPAASLDTVHTNIVGIAQTVYNESPNSAYLPNEDSSQAGTSSLNHSKRTWQNPHPRPSPCEETAFSVAAHVNNVNSTSSTTEDSSRVSICVREHIKMLWKDQCNLKSLSQKEFSVLLQEMEIDE